MGFIEDEQRFVARMTSKRTAKGMSQNEFAKQLLIVGLKWQQPTVARVEDGSRPLRFYEAMAIASFFGETIESMSAPETMTRWNVQVRLAAEAMLGEQLWHRHIETNELQSEVARIYETFPEEDLPQTVRSWLEWIDVGPSNIGNAAGEIHDLDRNLYEAAVEETKRIKVTSMHEVVRRDNPNAPTA